MKRERNVLPIAQRDRLQAIIDFQLESLRICCIAEDHDPQHRAEHLLRDRTLLSESPWSASSITSVF